MNNRTKSSPHNLSPEQKKILSLAYLVNNEWDEEIIKNLSRHICKVESIIRDWYTNKVVEDELKKKIDYIYFYNLFLEKQQY